jgi:hypothetical protein
MYIDEPPKDWRQISRETLDNHLMICNDYFRDPHVGGWDNYCYAHNHECFAVVKVPEGRVYADPKLLEPMEEEP